MIQISNTLRRNTLTPALSALVAAGLLANAGVARAQVDAQILAGVQAASTQNIESLAISAGALADKIGTGEIKSSKKNLKALSVGFADAAHNKIAVTPPSPTDPNRPDNKADEIGEIAAQIQEGIANNPKYIANKRSKGTKRTIIILKGVLKTVKKTSALLGTTVVRDVAGSVALTIHNDPGLDLVEEKIQKKLSKAKIAKKIAGKVNVTDFLAGLSEGFDSPVANTKYEDGNIDALSTIADPETDIRPA